MLLKKPKEKIKEVVESLDIGDARTVEAIKNIAKNNSTIAMHAKHLPKKKE